MILQPEITVRYVEEDSEYALVYSIRARVFQDEHGLEEETEIDGHEHISHHYLAFCDGLPVGTARWRMTMGGKAKLERFAVLPAFRKQGVGKALATIILSHIPSGRAIFLEALEDVVGFYEKMGFAVEGDAFETAGLMHRKMVLPA